MESSGSDAETARPEIELRLLGPQRLLRDGQALRWPPSRKLRALLAYLTLAARPVPRERLCALLWPVPDDPRGELRWSLSKLRALLDAPDRRRVLAGDDDVALDLSDCDVDALRLLAAAQRGVEQLPDEQLSHLVAAAEREFLEGSDLADSVEFSHWMANRRSEFHALHIALVAEAARRAEAGTAAGWAAARAWVELAPFDTEAHERFLAELFRRRLVEDCTRHLDRAERSFAAEAVDFAPVAAAWKRLQQSASVAAAPGAPEREQADAPAPSRASVAIMPFQEIRAGILGDSELGNALTHDIISRLARLRELFVIARGTVLAIAPERLGAREIGERLGVRYVVSGQLERRETAVTAHVEVIEAATSHLVWTDSFEAHTLERLSVLDQIGSGIVCAISSEIEVAERQRAVLKPPEFLDAWEAYHRGLWHMYRFTAEENEQAAAFFRLSAQRDPTFSRARAGLSFTHWQRAFQRWGDRDAETREAVEAATQSLLLDEQNPAAHWSMGRALWLTGDQGGAVQALEQSVALSPNFALGHYALSFVHSQAGDPQAAIAASDHSRLLSPHDPLLFGMLGTRAMALVRIGAFAEAAEWSVKAAARPNAHVHILAIAAHCLALAGRIEEARRHAGQIRRLNPGYRLDDFLSTFRFEADIRLRYRRAAEAIGLPI
ncbi:TPR_REGION domain-containing protein [Hyphomicrobiales bacterium]|nr:TPR_REGION domain-containing protein [Hyphomicrobiales bacterium]CAH1700515.1 TPR_REGION domain-containing protein [Hyphomicrobiales bacterium]CAI0344364.1 TPR_REGION domain-containing protein [Hyphomicrobiales bacterium]